MTAELELSTVGLVPPSASRWRRWGTNVVVTAAVGAAIVGIVRVFDRPAAAGGSQPVAISAAPAGPAPRVGKQAPDFRVQDLDGNQFQLSDFRGRPVWINFWDTWCPPCRAENPDIEAVFEAHRNEGLVVVALSVGESRSTVKAYAQRAGITYLIGLDGSTDIAAEYRLAGVPTHFFVDAEGIVRSFQIGGLSKKSMEARVAAILPAGGSPSGSQ